MWAKNNPAEISTGVSNGLAHLLMYRLKRRQIDQLTSNAGLIGRNSNGKTRVRQNRYRFHAAVDRFPLRGRLHKRVRVMIDDTIAIKNNEATRQVSVLLRREAGNISDAEKQRAQFRE